MGLLTEPRLPLCDAVSEHAGLIPQDTLFINQNDLSIVEVLAVRLILHPAESPLTVIEVEIAPNSSGVHLHQLAILGMMLIKSPHFNIFVLWIFQVDKLVVLL